MTTKKTEQKVNHRQEGHDFAQSLCHGMRFDGLVVECANRGYVSGTFDWSDFRFGFLEVIEDIHFVEVENCNPDSNIIDSVDYK